MPVKAGQIVIDITAGTKFVSDMDCAPRQDPPVWPGGAQLRQWRAGRLRNPPRDGGNVTNNLRAAERAGWVSLPGVANALKVAFPVVGARIRRRN